MPIDDYRKLLADAPMQGVDSYKVARCVDAVLAQEGIRADELIGLAPDSRRGSEVYVVHPHWLMWAGERGVFNKRVETGVKRSLIGLQDVYYRHKGDRLTGVIYEISGTDASGGETLSIETSTGANVVDPVLDANYRYLYQLVGKAMNSDTASSATVFAAAQSKSGALVDWAAEVANAAGVANKTEATRVHAEMAAANIALLVFRIQLGGPVGIDNLSAFFPSGVVPEGAAIERFDALYDGAVQRFGRPKVDAAVEDFLRANFAEFVRGCRESETAGPAPAAAPSCASNRCPCGDGDLSMEHMSEHLVDLKMTHNVEAFTYNCPICGFVEGELWSRTEAGRTGAPAGLYVHLIQTHNLG